MKKNLYAIGHITNDLEPHHHLGGGVSYTGVAAQKLGFQTHIITKCRRDDPYIKELENYGITVHRLPVRNPDNKNKITSFVNLYDDQGNRIQKAPKVQEDITNEDLKNFPNIPKDSVILVATVAGEVDTKLFPILAESNHLAVTPQGYFRTIDKNGTVNRTPWKDIDALSFATITVVSDEDLTFSGKTEIDEYTLNQIKERSKFTVLTLGQKGSEVYEKDKGLVAQSGIFRLKKDEVKDLTGAGDTFTAAYVYYRFEQSDNPKEALGFASFYTATKIMGLEGTGMKSAPRLEILPSFIQNHRNRFDQFLKENSLTPFPILIEGNNRPQERR